MEQKIINKALEKGVYYRDFDGLIDYVKGEDLVYSKAEDSLLQYTDSDDSNTYWIENEFSGEDYKKEWAVDRKDLQDKYDAVKDLRLRNEGYTIYQINGVSLDYKKDSSWGELHLIVDMEYNFETLYSLCRCYNTAETLEKIIVELRQEKEEIIKLLKEINNEK